MRDPAPLLAWSLQHLHWHGLVAGDVLHRGASQTVEIDLVARHEIEKVFQGDRTLHPGQRRAEAAVDAIAKTEVLRLGAVAGDVERLAVVERPGIPVGRGPHQENGFMRGDRAAGQLDVPEAVADV